jgi:hypothetical protein
VQTSPKPSTVTADATPCLKARGLTGIAAQEWARVTPELPTSEDHGLGKYWAAATTDNSSQRRPSRGRRTRPGSFRFTPKLSHARTHAHLNPSPPSTNKRVNSDSDSDSPMIHLYDLRAHRTQQATTSAKHPSDLSSASPTVEPIHIAYAPNMALLSAPGWSPSRRPWGRRRRWEVGAGLGLCCSDVEDG